MTQLENLLAATDFSPPSRDAALRAAMLARDTGARLELLHVVEASAMDELRRLVGASAEPVVAGLLDQAREKLASLAATVAAPLGIGAGTRLAVGPVLQTVADNADALQADLVVLGARGAGFMRRVLLGTTAERLMRKTLRPLLVVRQFAHEPYRRVLVPVDFSPLSSQAVRFARVIAPQAELTLFHAFEVPFEGKLRFAGVEEQTVHHYRNLARRQAVASCHELAADAGLAEGDYRLLVCHGEASTMALEQEEELAVDLIVMGKHGKGMSEELLLGSVTKHVLAEARCDVLVFR